MILFLSTGNAARSIMAEAILRGKGSARFTTRSAGLSPLPHIHPQTRALLAAENLNTENLHTKNWNEFLAASQYVKVDVIVTLSEEARMECPPWPGNPLRVHWPVDDPLSATTQDVMEWKFRKCFATLENRISALFKNRIAKSPEEFLLQLKDLGMVV